jgi:hypothetical protein
MACDSRESSNRFARKSHCKGQNPANSITCARPVIQPVQRFLNFSRTTNYNQLLIGDGARKIRRLERAHQELWKDRFFFFARRRALIGMGRSRALSQEPATYPAPATVYEADPIVVNQRPANGMVKSDRCIGDGLHLRACRHGCGSEGKRRALDCDGGNYTKWGANPAPGYALKWGLIITAAHLTAIDATMSMRIAGQAGRQ